MTYSVMQDEIPFLAFVLCGGTGAKRRLSVTKKLPSSGVFVALSNALRFVSVCSNPSVRRSPIPCRVPRRLRRSV